MNHTRIFSLIVFTLIVNSIFAKEPAKDYITVTAKKGQGAYAILRKYQLLDNQSNIDRFYEINKLKKNSELEIGKSYKLPIRIASFDGNTIRTTLNIKDYDKAKEIQEYNESIVNAKVKNKSFIKDKKLWVPEHYVVNLKATKKTLIREEYVSKKENTTPLEKDKRELIAEERLSLEEVKELELAYINKLEEVTSGVNNLVRKVSNKMLSVPLFGNLSEDVPVETDELKDNVFYIVPGHGGPDPGAVYKDEDNMFCEDEYAYDVSLRLARNLMTKGATVYVIVHDKNDGIRDERYLECDTDETCIGRHEMPESQIKRLRQGMIVTNQLYFKHHMEGFKNQWMISLHIDSQSESERQDVFFYYKDGNKKSKKKTKHLRSIFADKYKKHQGREYTGTISARGLYVINNSEPDPIFIELANIRNKHDRERICSSGNRQLLADWIMEGFIQ